MSISITATDVLKKIESDLDWRSPNGKALGHVVLTREEAHILVDALNTHLVRREP